MGFSGEVHARRTLEIRREARKAQTPGSWQAQPITGNAGLLPLAAAAGVMAGIIAWEREGRFLRSADIRRIPYVGRWLADHVPRWQDDCPRKRAASAAERRARAAQRAVQNSEARAAGTSGCSAVLTQEMSNEETHTAEQRQQQQKTAKKPRARKRSKKR